MGRDTPVGRKKNFGGSRPTLKTRIRFQKVGESSILQTPLVRHCTWYQ